MIASCSTWIVSTMSAIVPVRLAFMAASGLAGQPLVPGRIGDREIEHLVVQPDEPAGARAKMPPHPDISRRGGRGQVKRPRRIGPPVHQQLGVVVGIGVNAEPADIAECAVVELEPAKAQPVLRGIQLSQLLAVHHAEVVAFQPGLMRAAGLPQHARHPGTGARSQVIKPCVKHIDVILLAPQLCV